MMSLSSSRTASASSSAGSAAILVLLLLASSALKGIEANSMAEDDAGLSKVYRAYMKEIGGSGVEGTVIVMVISDDTLVYTADATGLPNNVDLNSCSGSGVACGVHLHSGTSCDDIGNFYSGNATSDTWVNPWLENSLKYRTGDEGFGFAGGIVQTGITEGISGKPFMMHDVLGGPITCGILAPIQSYFDFYGDMKVLTATTMALDGSDVQGQVTVVMAGANSTTTEGELCIFGHVMSNLEPNLKAYHHYGGENCTATNGCGVHIHSGTGCENSTVQGDHLYNSDSLDVDPWLKVAYPMTSATGETWFAQCLNAKVVNYTTFDGKPFIVHGGDGTPKSCGVLELQDDDASLAVRAHTTTAAAIATLVLGIMGWATVF